MARPQISPELGQRVQTCANVRPTRQGPRVAALPSGLGPALPEGGPRRWVGEVGFGGQGRGDAARHSVRWAGPCDCSQIAGS